MNETFDREIAKLLTARNKKLQGAERQRIQREADGNQFMSEWMQTRSSVVIPTLDGIVLTLGRHGVASKVDAYKGSGLTIGMALQDGRTAGGGHLSGQPSISFEPIPFTGYVKVDSADQARDVKLAEITPDFIKDAVLALAKKFIKP